MGLQEYRQVMRPAIETALREMVCRIIPGEFTELREMIEYHLGWEGEGAGEDAQGKRIRPLLTLLCAEAAGGCWRDALPAAAATELVHNFSLVHDDIQDNSPLRRGRPTVWMKWGVAQAINAGDVLLTLAFLALQDLSGRLPAQEILHASRLLQQACLHLIEGQSLDISYERRSSLPQELYWPMVEGKTSALLACCAELGALAGGANESTQASFHNYGYNLGLAFQVLDDWLGIWGDVALTGKSADSDLVSGKKTLPVLYALSKEGAFAQRWMKGSILPQEVPGVVALLEEEGAQSYTLETADEITRHALGHLRQAFEQGNRGNAQAYQALQELTRALLARNK